MAVTTPEWLTLHGCELRASRDEPAWTVFVNGEPQYILIPVPAEGKWACRVTETINGKRYDKGGIANGLEEAARLGLEDLRTALGW